MTFLGKKKKTKNYHWDRELWISHATSTCLWPQLTERHLGADTVLGTREDE